MRIIRRLIAELADVVMTPAEIAAETARWVNRGMGGEAESLGEFLRKLRRKLEEEP